jgi:hypothetical protein
MPRIIVGFAAGTTADIVARLSGLWPADRFDQPFSRNDPGSLAAQDWAPASECR